MMVEHLLRSARAGAPRLRVGVAMRGSVLPRPFAEALEHVLRCDFATVVVLLDEGCAAPGEANGHFDVLQALRSGSRRSQLLYELFQRWDASRVGDEANALLGPVDISLRLSEVPVIAAAPAGGGETLEYPQQAIDAARRLDLDVLLRLAPGRLDEESRTIARHGVWSYQLGDDERYRDGPASFWELAENDPVSAVGLVADLPGRSLPLVLMKGFADSCFDYSDLSAVRNSIKPLLLGSTFPIRKLKELHERGFATLEAAAVPPGPYRGRRAWYGTPSNGDMAQYLVPRLLRKPKQRLLRYSRLLRWRVAVRVDGSPSFDRDGEFDLAGFRWIDAPQGHAYADPFLIAHRGQTYCFFEDVDLARRRGQLSSAEVADDGTLHNVRPALELPYHLSYPFVFEDGGEIYMVPESSRNRTVDLFRAVDFPTRWERVRTLLDGPGLDTTILRHDGLYWFFIAVREPAGASEQLVLFHAESLHGKLRYHPKNPISIDIRRCRPAGAIFSHEGRLIRPSQDCSVTYGRQLNFNDILTLTPDDYLEERTLTVPPPTGMEGVHTYNRLGRFEVLDGKKYEAVARHVSLSSALKLYSNWSQR